MDKSLVARFTIPASDFDGFLRRGGLRARRADERRVLTREDRPQQAYRRLRVRLSDGRAEVRLSAFET